MTDFGGVAALWSVDLREQGHVFVPLDGVRRASAAEVTEAVRAREEAPDDWPWTLVSRAGFSAEGRALGEEAGIELRSVVEFLRDLKSDAGESAS